MDNKITRIVELQNELELLKMLNDRLEATNDKAMKEIEAMQAKRKQPKQLSNSQIEYVVCLLNERRNTFLSVFMRSSDDKTRKSVSEKIANINEIVGVIKSWI